jgi:hypothetical protein
MAPLDWNFFDGLQRIADGLERLREELEAQRKCVEGLLKTACRGPLGTPETAAALRTLQDLQFDSAESLDCVKRRVSRFLAPPEPAHRGAVECLRELARGLDDFQVALESQRECVRDFVEASQELSALNTADAEEALKVLWGSQEKALACIADLLLRVRRLLGPDDDPPEGGSGTPQTNDPPHRTHGAVSGITRWFAE